MGHNLYDVLMMQARNGCGLLPVNYRRLACQDDIDESNIVIKPQEIMFHIGYLEVLLFSNKSSSERGTLYQLKNLLHRTGVPTDPGT